MIDRIIERETSTRSSALLRIGLVLLLWTRFAPRLSPWAGFLDGLTALGVAFFGFSLLVFVGFQTRWASMGLAATMIGVVYGYGHYGPVEPFSHHHTTVLALATIWLAFLPSGRSYSVDRWLAVKRARARGLEPPPERGPTWALTLIALQVSAVYLWSAVDKASWAWLSGYKLDRIFTYLYFGFRVDHPAWLPFMRLLAATTVLLEVLLPIGLFLRSYQRFAIPVGIALHLLFYWLLPVGPFSLTMLLLYLAYLDPESVHRTIETVSER